MDRMPRPLEDDAWRPEGAVPVRDALSDLLDHLEARLEADGPSLPADPVPLSTGFPALDRVLGGGIRLGTLTVLDADMGAQGDAVLFDVVRRIEHPTLLVADDLLDATTWLLAGAADVPAVSLAEALLSQREWDRVAQAVAKLADRTLDLGEAETLQGVAHLARTRRPTVLAVRDLTTFGRPLRVVPALARLAATTGAAVVAAGTALGPLPPWVADEMAWVSVCSHGLGGRAALVRLDDTDLLSVAQVDVECLTGTVLEHR